MNTLAKQKDAFLKRNTQILATTTEFLSQSSHHTVTVNAIIYRAGINKDNLYWFFKSSQDMLPLLYENVGIRYLSPSLDVMQRYLVAQDRLETFATVITDGIEIDPDVISHVMGI